MMFSCLVPLLLLISTNLILAAAGKKPYTSISHHDAATSSNKQTNRALRPSPIKLKSPLTPGVRHRLYRKNRLDANGREMSKQEWEQMLKRNPGLEAKMDDDRRQGASNLRRRFYLREMIRKNPDKASKYIELGREDGFSVEDLLPGGVDKSPEAFDKRKLIRAHLVRLRKDIGLIGTKNEKTIPYDRDPAPFISLHPGQNDKIGHGMVEDQLLHEIGRFRAALRIKPYDPKLIAMRDWIHILMKRSFSTFVPVQLPHLSHLQDQNVASSGPTLSKSRESMSEPTTPSSSHPHGENRASPLTLEELQAREEEKRRYIHSLFN